MRRILGLACAIALLLGTATSDASPRRSQKPTYPEQPKDANAGGAGPTSDYESQFPLKMTWNLDAMNGKAPPGEATLKIDENLRGAGISGCNTWSAALYPVKGHRLAMGPVAQTKKACANDLMAFERLYLSILHSGPVWEQTGSTLTIKSQAGSLTFNRGL